MKRILAAGLMYFIAVLCVGFLLGIVRVLLLEPWAGTRWAELAEMPLMLAVIVLVAQWIVRRNELTTAEAAGTGFVAFGLLLTAEMALVVLLRGTSVAEYIASRDPVSGGAYVAMLLVFAAMPTIVLRQPKVRRDPSAVVHQVREKQT